MSDEPKVVLITGANSGLGYATVQALVKSQTPYRIIVCSRSQQKADDAIATLRADHGATKSMLRGMVLDYSSDESIQALVTRVESEIGRLDVVVNNGGVQLDPAFSSGKSNMTEREMWYDTWSINVVGPYLLSKAFVPLLLKAPKPRIVFITSGLASLGHQPSSNPSNEAPAKGWPKDPDQVGAPAYRASKTGLNQMMLQLRRILHNDGVEVMSVAPGVYATNLGHDDNLGWKKEALPIEVGGELMKTIVDGERDEDAEKGVVTRDGIQAW